MEVEVDNELFPPRQRVVYQGAPLVEVVCQLQFPTILKIGASEPVEFQEQVREQFPIFELENQAQSALPSQVAEMLGVQAGSKVYRFRDEGQAWTVSLSNEFISLSTTRYTRWEEFRQKLNAPLGALRDLYRPSPFSRIGLRYIDAIVRSNHGLNETTPWSALLAPHILGELAIPAVANSANEVHRRLAFADPATGTRILLNHGLQNVQVGKKPAVGYIIDFDFFKSGKINVNEAEGVFDGFNEMASRAFQWCITQKLHEALRPKPISN